MDIQSEVGNQMNNNAILTGGDNLFLEKSVIDYYDNLMNHWNFDGKKYALLMGCTMHKPFSTSFIHNKVIKMLEKNNLSNKIQQYIIGEPMVVSPREWEAIYPAAHYDFPPEEMTEIGRKIFVERLREFFIKANKHYEVFISFTPNHHKRIIIEAAKDIINPIYVSYNIYKLPTLRDTLIEVVQNESIPSKKEI